jgi:pimeloyl-ACP methyl ester carboxylesterase
VAARSASSGWPATRSPRGGCSPRADVDRARIGLWGFSQRGWVVPIAASRHRFAFLVACSAPAVSFAGVTLYADAARLRAHHLSAAEIGEAMRAERGLDDYLRHGGDAAAVQAMLDAARRSRWSRLTTLPAAIPTAAERRLYLRWIDLDLDPLAFWRRLNLPVLIAYGTADENVPAEDSARRIAAALAGRDVTLRRYSGANHNLVPAPRLEADLIEWTQAALRRPPA